MAKSTQGGLGATGSRGAAAAAAPAALPAPNFNGCPPNVVEPVKQIISLVQSQFPSMQVTATTNGTHTSGSYHYRGMAVDMAADNKAMADTTSWVNSTGIWKSLTEGIHNPGLAVKHGKGVDGPSFYSSVWEQHRDHIHFAIDPGDGLPPLPGAPPPATGNTNGPTGGGAGASSGGGGGGVSAADAQSIAKAAAFSTFLELPGLLDQETSLALKGNKSLMNDVPLLPFIEQLCSASLRNFMSMPNGDFVAFFPDYFGGLSNRTPYWEIHDIEVLDGHIDLSDDALATHVFVVGDVALFDGQITIIDKLQSSGVVNIFNAFEADFLNYLPEGAKVDAKVKPTPAPGPNQPSTLTLQDGKATFANNHEAALAFLQKYGARPSYNPMPMIRSPFYEMFVAYQTFMLMWSRQFVTTFEFTFMPELFPGGLVAFPEHGIQCYVEEVTHECSYTDGFTTRANLSAPSALTDQQGNPVMDSAKNIHAGMIRGFSLGNELPNNVFTTPPKKGQRNIHGPG